MIRLPPPPQLVSLRGFPIKTIRNLKKESGGGDGGAFVCNRTLDVELDRKNTTLVIDTQPSPTTDQQVSGGLGTQSTTVLARVYDPRPIPHDQLGISVNSTNTTDTIPGELTLGMADVMIDETEEPLASGRALCLPL